MPSHRVRVALCLTVLLLSASTARADSVLVWSTGNDQQRTEGVATWLMASGEFTSVTGIDTQNLTLTELLLYDKVLFFTNSDGDPGNGNVLADYADTGRRLVLTTFSWANQGGNTLGGRIITDGISPLLAGPMGSLYTTQSMQSNDGSGFFTGVNSVNGFFHDDVTLTSGATQRALWSDGEVLLATKRNLVAIDLFPDDSFGGVGGEYRQLFVNSLTADTGAQTVPEPASLALLATGLGGLAVRVRNRRRQG